MTVPPSGTHLGESSGDDPEARLLLAGRGGLWEGLRRVLKPGTVVTVGRSRSCDISLRRAPGFVSHDDPTAVFHSEIFRKVSRVHCEVELDLHGCVEIRDLSRNGVIINGERVIEGYRLPDDAERATLQLGDPAVGAIDLIRKRA